MENKRKILLAGFSVSAILLSAYFHFAAADVRERADLTARENEVIQNFKETPAETSFLYPTVSDLTEAAADMTRRGIRIEKIGEAPPLKKPHGEILRLSVSGAGHFAQLLEMFDIIHGKERWMQVEFRRIVREGDHLRFEADLTAYRGRGTE